MLSREDMEFVEPSVELIGNLAELMARSLSLNQSTSRVNVEVSPEAKKLFRNFEIHSVEQRNKLKKEGDDIQHTLWNRSKLKAMKLASLVAVGKNNIYPTIDAESAQWAIDFTNQEIKRMIHRFKTKDIGNTSEGSINNMTNLVERWIHLWFEMTPAEVSKKFTRTEGVYRTENVLPLSYLSRKCGNNNRLESLKGAVDMCVRNGYIFRILDQDVIKIKNKHGVKSVNPKQAEVYAVDQSFFDKLNGEGE